MFKKIFALVLVLSVLMAWPAWSDKPRRYGCTALTGGGPGALDALKIVGGDPDANVYPLISGTSAVVVMLTGSTATVYEYVFDALGSDPENAPDIIRPNDFVTAGVWRRAKTETDAVFLASPAAGITDPGSGIVISAAERAKLLGIADGAQVNPAAATDLEVTAGTETNPRLVSPAQLKLAAQTHGIGASYPGVTSDGADGLTVVGGLTVGTLNHGVFQLNDDLTFIDPNNPLGVTLSQLLGAAAGLDWTVDQGEILIHAGNIPDLSNLYALSPGAVANALYGWNASGVPEAKTSVSVDIDLGLQTAIVTGRMGRDAAYNITMGNGTSTETFSSDDNAASLSHKNLTGSGNVHPIALGLAIPDDGTALTSGTSKFDFRMPHAMTVTAVRANVSTAAIGAAIVVDINEGGTSILSTKLSIDAGETTSITAVSAAVITDAALADDGRVTIDVDQVGSSTAGLGLKIWLIGTREMP